jgi:hypothetical protein
MQRKFHRRLRALENRIYGSPKAASYFRWVEAMSDDELAEAIIRLESGDDGDRRRLDLSGADWDLCDQEHDRRHRRSPEGTNLQQVTSLETALSGAAEAS